MELPDFSRFILLQAASNGSVVDLRLLSDNGDDIDTSASIFGAPSMGAAMHGRIGAVSCLIGAEANLDARFIDTNLDHKALDILSGDVLIHCDKLGEPG